MDKQVWKQAFWLILGFIMIILPVSAQAIEQEALPQIIINLPSRTLELYQGDTLIKEYQIAIGKPAKPTPIGEFSIIEKDINPCWYPPGKDYVVPSGPNNPLGYRWLGVAPMYGIHGTNAPWSIGLAVSNGCVRMQEEDVEELFELVNCNTLVKVEYERVKVRVDAKGRASIGIYPDVYGRQNVTLAIVRQSLKQLGLDGLVSDGFLQNLIDRVPDRQVTFAQLHNLKINGTLRPERIVSWQNKKHVPVMALADSLHTSVEWNDGNQTLTRQTKAVPGIKRGNIVYVNVEHLSVLFGGQTIWDESQNCLELRLPVAKLDGQLLTGDIHRIGNTLVIPALTLAQALGERVKWLPDTGQLLMHGRSAPIMVMGDQPFVAINDVGNLYNVASAWDAPTQTVEMSYPLHTIDYSMYIDPGDEYL